MDAAWHVYIQDRRFDDDEISNTFVKYKWESVGRFTFDLRLQNTEEATYFATGNTLRIFWGDKHKLDGVIQRVDWDDDNYCHHVYGADIRGLLLDRVVTQPATVNSYTSDIATTLVLDSCEFPSNVWTVAGGEIGRYTFNYKLGIHNTIRITRQQPMYIWEANTVIERGTVYEHRNGCLYDATKDWDTNEYQGMVLRFVSGACKNNVFNICGNSSNKVCIRMATENCTDFATDEGTGGDGSLETATEGATQCVIDGIVHSSMLANCGWESATTTPWKFTSSVGGETYTLTSDAYDGSYALYAHRNRASYVNTTIGLQVSATQIATSQIAPGSTGVLSFWVKPGTNVYFVESWLFFSGGDHREVWYPTTTDWTLHTFTVTNTHTYGDSFEDYGSYAIQIRAYATNSGGVASEMDITYDGIQMWAATTDEYWGDIGGGDNVMGRVPGCSRLGDIYEIVTTKRTLTYRVPPDLANATLEKNNHIVRFNEVDDLTRHTTTMTVRGS